MKKFLTAVLFIACFSTLYIGSVFAADFNVRVVREYYIDTADKVRVEETHALENKSAKSWISEGNTEYFFVSVTSGNGDALTQTLQTVNITANGTKLSFETDNQGDYAILSVKLPSAIKPSGTMTFKITYDNYGLIEQKGALIDFYAPGFKQDQSSSTGEKTTSYSYDTYIDIAKNLPAVNFITPESNETGQTDLYTRYYFNYETLLNRYIWIQIGRTQYYKFSITQNITATEQTNTGYTNEYRLIVPRVIDEPQIYQKVFFTSIDPVPDYAELDVEGNLVLIFKEPTSLNGSITINGFAEVGRNDTPITAETAGTIYDPLIAGMGNYLEPGQYWEVGNAQIQSTASTVVGKEKNVFIMSSDLYNFVIGKIDYSTVKRFGLNERQGALATLNGGAAVCMEYSDLFLTLARAAGIPTRAVFGYGYDSKIQNDQQEAHQWVEVFMPGLKKWVTVDVTWGESGMKMAEGNLNHFFTHVTSVDPNTPSLVERKSYGSEVGLDTPTYKIEAVASITDVGGLKTQDDLITLYPKPPTPTGFWDNVLSKFEVMKTVNVSSVMITVGAIMMIVSAIGIAKMLKSKED